MQLGVALCLDSDERLYITNVIHFALLLALMSRNRGAVNRPPGEE